MDFNRSLIKSFHFVSFDFNEKESVASFRYAFDNSIAFEERLIFPKSKILTPNERKGLENCLKYLHLALGISYYKAAVPDKIVIDQYSISYETANFFNNLYIKGLGEFAYKNKIDLKAKVRFPSSNRQSDLPSNIELVECITIPVGGGKDSIITIDALKSLNKPLLLFSLGKFMPTCKISAKVNLPCVYVERQLSPNLFAINSQGALNGHVPFSAILAFILPVSSILYGFNIAALSNERSANKGSLLYKGIEINHQYSKSFEFEKSISNFIKRHVLSNFHYFSFLRPLSDIGIAKLFSKLNHFHEIFVSCNSAYKINQKQNDCKWCLKCPKCRFTFLALAPFMEKASLISIFGKNLLDDENQIEGFDELTGIRGVKPFECVGDIDESIAAFLLLINKENWNKDIIVQRFIRSVLPTIERPEEIISNTLSISNSHLLPECFYRVLNAYSRP